MAMNMSMLMIHMGQFLQGGKNGSSLAHLEPKLELFEVLEFGS